LKGCNRCATPMGLRIKLSRDKTTSLVDGTAYKILVGSLRYLGNIRPALAYSIGYVSRFMERLTQEHLAVVKRIIRYVARTLHLGCQYKKDTQWKLVGYCDSDMAGDIDTSKCTTGVAFFLGKI
jgi:hypothetical protein